MLVKIPWVLSVEIDKLKDDKYTEHPTAFYRPKLTFIGEYALPARLQRFSVRFQKPGYFSLFLQFLEKILNFSKQPKNAKFRFLGVKSNFSRSPRNPSPSETGFGGLGVLLKPARSAA